MLSSDQIIIKEYESTTIDINQEEKEIIEKEFKDYIDIENTIKIDRNRYLCSIKANYHVGLLKLSDLKNIIIQPKIPLANFIAMLAFINADYATLYNDLIRELKKETSFFSAFIEMFLDKVEDFSFKHFRKDYTRLSSLKKVPKGKINVYKSLMNITSVIPQFWIESFYPTVDTPNNQVIKFTLEFIRFSIPEKSITKYRRIMNLLEETKYKQWTSAEIDQLSYNRLTEPYKEIHSICKIIIEDFSVNFQTGKRNFFSFVMNAWNVYEKFLRKIIERYQTVYSVDAIRIKRISQKIDWDNRQSNKMRPDIILHSDEGIAIMIDAKYKQKFDRNDRYQIYSYMGDKNVRNGYLIYPLSDSLNEEAITSMGAFGTGQIDIKYKLIDLSRITNEKYLQTFVSDIIS